MYTEYLNRLIQALQSVQIYDRQGILLENREEAMQKLTRLFLLTRNHSRQAFFIGNGGSAAIASHMTADFLKNGRMRTQSLYDHSLVTCMGNDYGYEHIFSYPLERLADKGDLLVAVSSSGNSPNIVNAVQTARRMEMSIVTLSGFEQNNQIRGKGDYNIYVPVKHYGITESVHHALLQQIVDTIAGQDERNK